MYDKTKFIYAGIDLHKEQHTAVIMDCFNEKLGEITFQNKPSKQGNRRLQGTIYFFAIQMIQLSSKGLPRNPAFYVYYQKQLTRGKTKPQALILLSRRLINIIYGMLKNKIEYVMSPV